MNGKKISFLVPTLGNRPVEIRRLFDTLCSQTYSNIEVVIVVQSNYEKIYELFSEYETRLEIQLIEDKEKGLSKARNKGLPFCKGDVIVLSDDDCWYPSNSAEIINRVFEDGTVDVVVSKIYDLNNKRDYKSYSDEETTIKSVFKLLSRSSIEIAFSNRYKELKFDERFGLGSKFVCCEEVDYLLRIYKDKGRIKYIPQITVYHDKKYNGSTRAQVVAKGAIYSKHFNIAIGALVCIKDFVARREMNFKPFFEGYDEYKRIN